METIYLSMRAQVAVGTFFMKSLDITTHIRVSSIKNADISLKYEEIKLPKMLIALLALINYSKRPTYNYLRRVLKPV